MGSWKPKVVLLLRLILGGLFVWAAVPKILDAANLAQAMAGYRLLPESLLVPAAYFLPWLELLAGVGLITGVGRRGAALWINLLLLLFLVALASTMIRGLNVDCGCFGTAPAGSGAKEALLRDLLLLPLGLIVLWADRPAPKRYS